MKKILLVFTIFMFSCSLSFAETIEFAFGIDATGKTIRIVDANACEIIGTISKVVPHGKVVYGICKGVKLANDVVEYFCQDAVVPQECESDTITAIGTGHAAGYVVPFVGLVGGVGVVYWWLFSDDESE